MFFILVFSIKQPRSSPFWLDPDPDLIRVSIFTRCFVSRIIKPNEIKISFPEQNKKYAKFRFVLFHQGCTGNCDSFCEFHLVSFQRICYSSAIATTSWNQLCRSGDETARSCIFLAVAGSRGGSGATSNLHSISYAKEVGTGAASFLYPRTASTWCVPQHSLK
jgi:hypothetical protein